jgi:hypothetical protein
MVEQLPHSRRYRLLTNGYRICLLFLKLFDKIYAPLTAGFFIPILETGPWRTIACTNSSSCTNLSQPPWIS